MISVRLDEEARRALAELEAASRGPTPSGVAWSPQPSDSAIASG
jgi:hypothetical protein